MKLLVISLLTFTLACFVYSVSAQELPIANDELRDLRTRVKQLEAEVQKLKSDNQSDTARNTSSLAAAVQRFNARYKTDPIGRTQQDLTVAEVIAAIRWIQPDDVPVTAEEFAEYKKIAETKNLPPDADLEVISRFVPSDKFKFQAWSIRLRIPRSAKKGWTYAFPIRQRWISSTSIADRGHELKQLRGSTLDRILQLAPEKSFTRP